MGGRSWCVVMVMVMVTVMVTGETVLQCNVDCVCKKEYIDYEHNYFVKCNATALQEAALTDVVVSVMEEFGNVSLSRTSVSVKGGPSLTLNVTLDFLEQWRESRMCQLSVEGVGRVLFPPVIPHSKLKDVNHLYAGVSLTGVEMREVPAGLFRDKLAAEVILINSTVDRLPKSLLAGAGSLSRLHILNSTVGVVGNLVGGRALTTKNWLDKAYPVQIVNSTVGVLSRGAIHFRLQHHQTVLLQGLALARVEQGAVEVEGAGKVVVERCGASSVERGGIVVRENGRFTLRNNWLVLQPGAFTQLACGKEDHRLYNNYITLLTMLSPSQQQRQAHTLTTVLHPSCVNDNTAYIPDSTPSPAPSPSPALSTTPSSTTHPIGKMAMMSLIGVGVGVIVLCLTLMVFLTLPRHCRRRSRDRGALPTITMSQLQQDPIYDVPCLPPPVPAFPDNLRRTTPCYIPKDSPGGENAAHPREENDYITMK